MTPTHLRWRKFSPLDRDSPIFELMDDEIILLDVSEGENGQLEVTFHEAASSRTVDLAALEQLFAEVRRLLDQEEANSVR